VAGGLSFGRVSAGTAYTCGETTDDRAYCWGSNNHGQLGDGTGIQRRTPVAVAGWIAFKQVSAALGGLHTCGKTSAGVVYCWGSNGNGELGDGTTEDRLSPVPVAGTM
jgi:alpha-tubulin suppressor-like RCC1 family protein